MKNLLIVVSTNRGLSDATKVAIEAQRGNGAKYVEQQGCSDVALARNLALTQAVEVLQENKEIDTVLMIDDDIVFGNEQVQQIVKYSQSSRLPVAACVATVQGNLSGRPISKTLWETGLSFLAIPRHKLLELVNVSKSFKLPVEGDCYVFTWCGMDGKQWISEDYRLCRRLGGVKLIPVRVGHLKKIPIWVAEDGQEKELGEWLNKQLETWNG